ncbi:MAG: hypothetical protein RL331_1323 [Bacteroidota bacterium]|jgi:hypothetical protein
MKQLSVLVKAHPYLTTYLFVYALLQVGLLYTSGLTYATPLFFLFFVPFLTIYIAISNLNFPFSFPVRNFNYLERSIFLFALLMIVIHLFWLGKIPFVEAWQASKLSDANSIRKLSSAGLPKWLHYASTWSIRALLPASALFFLYRKNYIGFFLSICVGSFYGLALLQKSLIFWLGFPVLVYFFLNRKWWAGILSTLVMGVLFVVAVFANNPQLHGGQHDLQPTLAKKGSTHVVSEGILKRIFMVPGKTMSMWFAHVPKDKPYLYGRDFGPYAKLTGQKTADYNLELYALFYPDYAKQGVQGSVNTAHFMRTYANFGWWGLPLAAALLAFFFQFLNKVHRKTNAVLAFSLQIFPLLLLSSGSLLTLLFSGGWGLILLLLLSSPTKESAHA